MSSFILERCRSLCEETEILEKMIVMLFGKLPRDSITSLIIEIAIKNLGIQIQKNSEEILSIYLDSSGDRKKEISYLGGNNVNDKNELSKYVDKQSIWTNFYDSIKSVTSTNGMVIDLTKSNNIKIGERRIEDFLIDILESIELNSIFIPEEDLGRRLYLESNYSKFINLKKLRNYRETKYINGELEKLRRKGKINDEKDIQIVFEEIDFSTYLKTYDQFSDIPRYFKYKDNDYEEYISSLLEYLKDFFLRSHPLLDENDVEKELNKDFEQSWNRGVIIDWRIPTNEMLYYSKPFDKLFFSEGTYNSHLKSKHYKKEENKYLLLSEEEKEKIKEESINYDKNMSRKEFLINKYSQLLSIQRREAIDHINKLQSSTKEELELDKQLEDNKNGIRSLINELKDLSHKNKINNNLNSASDSDSDDIDDLQDKVYNPLKLPLGPDGRPMPYWLFKLNGLGIEFKCEICGNCSYWGRRAFERHFQESKHANGLSALGIPNTCHFKEITKISDALDLYSTLCKQAKELSFDEQNNLEMEDSEGNVLPLRSFQNLYRQGLI